MNPLLTPGMERALRLMRDGNEEMVCEGREVWIGLERTSRLVERNLLGLCLIHDESDHPASSVRRYVINSDGRKVLDDPAHIPLILREREGRLGAIMWIRTRGVVNAIQNLPPLPEGHRR